MASRKEKRPSRPQEQQQQNRIVADQPAQAPASVNAAVWAEQLVIEQAELFPEEEKAILVGQVQALGKVCSNSAPLPPDPTVPTVIRDRMSLRQVADHLKAASEVVIDLETSTLDPLTGEIVGVGLSNPEANYYIPTGHLFEESRRFRPDQLPIDVVAKELRLDQLPLIAHNAKFELRWLRRHAGVTCRFIWDVMLAARLLAPHLPADLKDLAVRELDVPDWGLSKQEIKKVQLLPVERVARYCAKDCYYTLELYRRQQACVS